MSNDVRRIGSDQSKALDSSTEEYTHLDAGHLSMNSECDARSTTRSPSPNSINLLKIAENKHRRLSAVLANSSELKKLIKQLKVEHSEENILFLQDLKHWKQITDLIEMKKEVRKQIEKNFLLRTERNLFEDFFEIFSPFSKNFLDFFLCSSSNN